MRPLLEIPRSTQYGCVALLVYFICVNIVGAAVFAYDKHCARKGKFRISERSLFLLAFFGGATAMWITMHAVRHKTLHKSFRIGLPLLSLLQLFGLAYLFLSTFA